MNQHDDGYEPSEHPIKELFYWAVSPIGWVVFVFLLLLF